MSWARVWYSNIFKRGCLPKLSTKQRAIITESLTDIAPVAVDENASDAAADNTRYEPNDNRNEDVDHKEALMLLVDAKESVDDTRNVLDQMTKKFAIHAIIATLMYALTTAKCCARSVQNKKNTGN